MSAWSTGQWLAVTLLAGGGLLLLAAVLAAVVRQPVRRWMIGAAAVRIALLVPILALGPKWLRIDVAQPAEPSAAVVAPRIEALVRSNDIPERPAVTIQPGGDATAYTFFVPAPEAAALAPPPTAPPAPQPVTEARTPIAPAATAPWLRGIPWLQIALAVYGLIASAFLARWLLGHVALRRFVRRSRPASRSLCRLFERIAPAHSVVPELRVVAGLPGPVCCGLWRPVVLLPQALAEAADEESLRWVFAHELSHLRHGDAWTAFWFGLAKAIYFPVPWFWWLKARVELCQEYVADAEAAGDARTEEYAAFLVNLTRTARPVRPLAGVSGVLGTPSELYRRITMLLDRSRRVDQRCPRRWSLIATGSFLALAVLLSGLGLNRDSAAAQDTPKEEKKDDAKKDKPKAEEPKKDPPKKGEEEKPVRPKRPDFRNLPFPGPGGAMDAEELNKYIQKMMEEMQKRFGDRGFGGAWAVPGGQPFSPFGGGGNVRLGAVVEKPHAALVEQLDLPKDQGVVLTDVKADSAAAKAGLKANDILLEINGKPVSSDPREFRKQLADVKADTAVEAVVLRKGKRETIKGLKLPEAAPEAENAFGPFVQPPALPIPNAIPVPRVEIAPAFGGEGGGKSMSVQINNGSFTIHSKDDDLDITLGGKIEDGKTTVNSVKITDGNDKHSYDSMDNVPEKYREKVKGLLKNITVNKAK